MQVTEKLRQVLALRLLKSMGGKTFQDGLTAFGSVEAFLRSKARQVNWPAVDKEIELAARHGVEIIPCFDERYPVLLREVFDPPIALYVKGRLPEDSATWLAVVGSRDASWQGLRTASTISKELAASGAVVVSGLARGIDGAAHRGALEGRGLTVAVLGNGLADVYPPENRKLAGEILARGALVSEFPMETAPLKMNFPMRNRIISGLSRAVVVVEAREKSGALITVDCALEQGREVYVFPGDAGSKRAFGSNDLLKQGAKPATSAEDILRDFGLSKKKAKAAAAKQAPSLNAEEKALLRLLKQTESLHVDQIVEKSVLSPQQTMTLLTTMAVKGVVRELPGKYFAEAAS